MSFISTILLILLSCRLALLSDLDYQPSIHQMHEILPLSARILARELEEMFLDFMARALPVQLRATDRALHVSAPEHALERGLLALARVLRHDARHRVEPIGYLVHEEICRPLLRLPRRRRRAWCRGRLGRAAVRVAVDRGHRARRRDEAPAGLRVAIAPACAGCGTVFAGRQP